MDKSYATTGEEDNGLHSESESGYMGTLVDGSINVVPIPSLLTNIYIYPAVLLSQPFVKSSNGSSNAFQLIMSS